MPYGAEIIIDIGDTVLCDFCNEDFTNSDALGGLLFQSKGVCPTCEPEFMANVKKHGEERFIRDKPLEFESFRAFILRIRGGNNTVTVTTFNTEEDYNHEDRGKDGG